MTEILSQAVSQPLDSRVSDFVALLKPRVMSLVVFSGFAGLWLAPGVEAMNPVLAEIAMRYQALAGGR